MQTRVDLRVDATAEVDPAVLAQAKEVCVLYYTCVIDAERAATSAAVLFLLFFLVLDAERSALGEV